MADWQLFHGAHNKLVQPGVYGTALNPLIEEINVDVGRTITSLDDGWEKISNVDE